MTGAFGGLYLDGTLERVDTRTGDALRALVGALESGDSVDDVAEELRGQGLSSDELDVLERSAREVRRIEELFRPYVSPELAVGLEEAPAGSPGRRGAGGHRALRRSRGLHAVRREVHTG